MEGDELAVWRPGGTFVVAVFQRQPLKVGAVMVQQEQIEAARALVRSLQRRFSANQETRDGVALYQPA